MGVSRDRRDGGVEGLLFNHVEFMPMNNSDGYPTM